MPLPPVLESIVSFLHAGYPEGVPERDYIPLLALVSQRLGNEAATADPNDVERIRHKLAAVGWQDEATRP